MAATPVLSVAPALVRESPPATLADDVEDVLATLTPRERRVLVLRYVVIGSRERTAEEVGRRLGVPHEQITRIEAQALAKLRVP